MTYPSSSLDLLSSTLLESIGGSNRSIFGLWSFVQCVALEEPEWHEFDKDAPQKFTRTKGDAEQVLVHFQWIGLCDSSTDFHNHHLDDESEDDDKNEKRVS